MKNPEQIEDAEEKQVNVSDLDEPEIIEDKPIETIMEQDEDEYDEESPDKYCDTSRSAHIRNKSKFTQESKYSYGIQAPSDDHPNSKMDQHSEMKNIIEYKE